MLFGTLSPPAGVGGSEVPAAGVDAIVSQTAHPSHRCPSSPQTAHEAQVKHTLATANCTDAVNTSGRTRSADTQCCRPGERACSHRLARGKPFPEHEATVSGWKEPRKSWVRPHQCTNPQAALLVTGSCFGRSQALHGWALLGMGCSALRCAESISLELSLTALSLPSRAAGNK